MSEGSERDSKPSENAPAADGASTLHEEAVRETFGRLAPIDLAPTGNSGTLNSEPGLLRGGNQAGKDSYFSPQDFMDSMKAPPQEAAPSPITVRSTEYVEPATKVIPTLHSFSQKDGSDATLYRESDKAAQVFDKAKDSIVRLRAFYGSTVIEENAVEFGGTGFIISEDGKLATAFHVVDDSPKRIIAVLPDGRSYDAKIVETKPGSDMATLAIIAAPGERFPALPLATSSRPVKENDPVFVVGHPHLWNRHLSVGTLVHRIPFSSMRAENSIKQNPQRVMLETTAPAVGGSSGSPLLNKDGQVVGVVAIGGIRGSSAVQVEDLHALLGDAKTSDYFPQSLVLDRTTLLGTMNTVTNGLSTYALSRGRLSGGFATAGALASGFAAYGAARDLRTVDYNAFVSSWSEGSAAERFSATTNLAADIAVIGGGIGMAFVAPKYKFATSAVVTGGSAAKMLNHMLSDRAY